MIGVRESLPLSLGRLSSVDVPRLVSGRDAHRIWRGKPVNACIELKTVVRHARQSPSRSRLRIATCCPPALCASPRRAGAS